MYFETYRYNDTILCFHIIDMLPLIYNISWNEIWNDKFCSSWLRININLLNKHRVKMVLLITILYKVVMDCFCSGPFLCVCISAYVLDDEAAASSPYSDRM